MQFADALASSIHDIKNSLGVVQHNLDQLLNDPQTHIGNTRQASVLKLETQRANANLVQLLSLYKLEKDQLSPELDEYPLQDFLGELRAENQELMQALGIELSCSCDPDVSGYFDEALVRNVLNSCIGNALRYTRSRIVLGSTLEEGYLVIRVEDDGQGYPQQMLQQQAAAGPQIADSEGHTQLGLYFAAQVAALHHNGSQQGRIHLRNNHSLPGGCFELWLP